MHEVQVRRCNISAKSKSLPLSFKSYLIPTFGQYPKCKNREADTSGSKIGERPASGNTELLFLLYCPVLSVSQIPVLWITRGLLPQSFVGSEKLITSDLRGLTL